MIDCPLFNLARLRLINDTIAKSQYHCFYYCQIKIFCTFFSSTNCNTNELRKPWRQNDITQIFDPPLPGGLMNESSKKIETLTTKTLK